MEAGQTECWKATGEAAKCPIRERGPMCDDDSDTTLSGVVLASPMRSVDGSLISELRV